MEMLKHTSGFERKEIDSGRNQTYLDESLVEEIMKKNELSASFKDLDKPDLKTRARPVLDKL